VNSLDQRPKDLRGVYDSIYGKAAEQHENHREYDQLRRNLVVDFIASLRLGDGAEILDLGSGETPYVTELSHFHTYACADLSAVGLRSVERKYETSMRDKLVLVVCSAESLPFRCDTFDLVICTEALEHFVEPEQALREICSITRRWLVFSTTCTGAPLVDRLLYDRVAHRKNKALRERARRDGWEVVFLEVWRKYRSTHVNSFTRHMLSDMFSRAGFRMSKTAGAGFRLPLPKRTHRVFVLSSAFGWILARLPIYNLYLPLGNQFIVGIATKNHSVRKQSAE